jgi:NAD(P)-dependent dehydrogenase (short-subunit alcohol dehydrogenase family)
MKLLDQRVVVVSGRIVKPGLGWLIAHAAAAYGADVALLDRDGRRAAAAAATLRRRGSRIVGIGCAFDDPEAVDVAGERVMAAFSHFHVWVNVVDGLGADPAADDAGAAATGTLERALHRTAILADVFSLQMASKDYPAILHVARPRSRTARTRLAAASTAMARDLADLRVRVNAVFAPQPATAMPERERHRGALTTSGELHARGRAGGGDDVAGVCVLLASALAAPVTGAVIDVDGGVGRWPA